MMELKINVQWLNIRRMPDRCDIIGLVVAPVVDQERF